MGCPRFRRTGSAGSLFTDKLYTGQREMEGLGIYHYKARFYSPALGRFLSPDTIIPGAANPQAFNRYSYVLNNPLKYIDPTGHKWDDCKKFDSDVQCKQHMQHVNKIKAGWAAENAGSRAGQAGGTITHGCLFIGCGSGGSNPFGGSYSVAFGGGMVGGDKGSYSPLLSQGGSSATTGSPPCRRTDGTNEFGYCINMHANTETLYMRNADGSYRTITVDLNDKEHGGALAIVDEFEKHVAGWKAADKNAWLSGGLGMLGIASVVGIGPAGLIAAGAGVIGVWAYHKERDDEMDAMKVIFDDQLYNAPGTESQGHPYMH